MLTFLPSGVLPDTDALANGALINDDGHGFAIVDGQRLIVGRGMTAERMIAKFAKLRHKHPAGPALFHSRFGTHGKRGTGNCHPFRVGGDRDTVLAHNGILPWKVRPRAGDRRCDTRIAAEDFLPQKPCGSFSTQRGRARLENWMGPNNKIVILTVNRRYRRNAYLLNEHRGIWDNGTWYSNNDYLDFPVTGASQVATDEVCAVCHWSSSIDTVTGFCRACGFCQDCYEPGDYCRCYLPRTLTAHEWTDGSAAHEL
ncbi:hypothetical protein [Amycolatopsis sp. NPDC059657]|uniref:hypothetical protein n=1 Tax=Amycolatopsis sp. NPDC059657 TaxID=3346899 RepID=UPI00366D5313